MTNKAPRFPKEARRFCVSVDSDVIDALRRLVVRTVGDDAAEVISAGDGKHILLRAVHAVAQQLRMTGAVEEYLAEKERIAMKKVVVWMLMLLLVRAGMSAHKQGEGLTYQWYYKNPGDTQFTAGTCRQVYCVITDSRTSVKSKIVTLRGE